MKARTSVLHISKRIGRKTRASERVKSSIFLTCIGSRGREINNTFNFKNGEDQITLSVIITKFDKYCTARKTLNYLRHKFFTYRQKEGQSCDDFVTQLKKLASNCKFSTLKESLIRDIIVVGPLDNRLRKRILRDTEKAQRMWHSAEETNKHIKELTQDEGGNHIDMIQQNSKHGQQQNITNQCQYCSGKHQRGACPAFNRFCNKCGKKRHVASCCAA